MTRIVQSPIRAAALAMALLGPVFPAHALDDTPQGSRQKERHVFRDVQLGLSHPSTHGQSTQTSAPPKPLFPWLPAPADPGGAGQGTAPR